MTRAAPSLFAHLLTGARDRAISEQTMRGADTGGLPKDADELVLSETNARAAAKIILQAGRKRRGEV